MPAEEYPTKGVGMGRLVFAELRYGYRPWLAVWAVSAAAALCVQAATALVVIGRGMADREAGEAYGTNGGFMLALTLPTAIIAVAITASLCVRLASSTVARWQLAGVTPRQAGRVVRAELMVVCALGAVVGAALGYAVWPWIADLVVAALLPDSAALRAAPPAVVALWTVLIVVAVGLVAGGAAARRTRKVEPIEVLRTVEADERKVGILRVALAVVLVGGVVAGTVAIAGQDVADSYDRVMGLSAIFVPFAMVVIAALVALGPWVYAGVMRAWTAIWQGRRSVSWFLARHGARSHLAYSSGVITPLFVAAAAVGVTYQWVSLSRTAATTAGLAYRGTGAPLGQVVLMFGGAVLVAAVATAGVVFASAKGKERDTALLSVSGATRGPIMWTAILESVIYVVTTLILALVALLVAGGVYTLALRAGPIPGLAFQSPPVAVYVVGGAGLVFIMAATSIPVARSLRGNVMDVLRAE